MSNQPIIFDVEYTPYRPSRNATADEVKEHKRNRAFYDMSGGNTYFHYMVTDGKVAVENTFSSYLQKNTGVFNLNGLIQAEEVKEMLKRARENKGNIWHGFISLHREDSYKIDTPEKCMDLIKRTFPAFFKECKISQKNLDLMCALHIDKDHLHIHFGFWEKEPKFKNKDGNLGYRAKGKIPPQAIENMKVRLALATRNDKGALHKARDNALQRLRKMTYIKTAMTSRNDIKEEILALVKDLPKKGRLSYGSKDMEPFRGRVDKIVQMILDYDKEARKSNTKFYLELDKSRKFIEQMCGKRENSEIKRDHTGNNIDLKNIHVIEDIEMEYKRRQGNQIIDLVKAIKPEYYERNKKVKYEANDTILKKKLSMSQKIITRHFNNFFKMIGSLHNALERDFSRRLQEIEEEMKAEKKQQEQEAAKNNYKGVNYKD